MYRERDIYREREIYIEREILCIACYGAVVRGTTSRPYTRHVGRPVVITCIIYIYIYIERERDRQREREI